MKTKTIKKTDTRTDAIVLFRKKESFGNGMSWKHVYDCIRRRIWISLSKSRAKKPTTGQKSNLPFATKQETQDEHLSSIRLRNQNHTFFVQYRLWVKVNMIFYPTAATFKMKKSFVSNKIVSYPSIPFSALVKMG